MGLPFLEVSHLPSSTSFYSNILQPLGLRYLGTDRDNSASVGTVTYGFAAHGRVEALPILQIREASHPFEPPRASFIVFAASSPPAVADFHECALSANPWLGLPSDEGFSDPRLRLGIDGGPSPGRATIRDLDNNTIQVIAAPPNAQQDVGHVLDWQFDTASRSKQTLTRSQSHPIPSPSSSSTSSHAHSQAPFQIQSRSKVSSRSAHVAFGSPAGLAMSPRAPSQVAEEPEPFPEPSMSPRQSSSNNGLSTTTVVGALLGVAAAGAALTYTFASGDRERRPRHEFDPPPMPRRSTFPQKAPSSHHKSRHEDQPPYPEYGHKALAYRPAPNYERPALPAPLPYPEEVAFREPAYQDDYGPRKLTYPEEYAPKKPSYPDDYIPRKMPYDIDEEELSDEPPPRRRSTRSVQYLSEDPLLDGSRSVAARSSARSTTKSVAKSTAGRSSAGRSSARSTARSTTKSAAKSVALSRGPDEIEEVRSRHSSRHSRASGRSRSEAPAPRAETVIDHRSHISSRHSVAGKSTYSRARSQRGHDADRDTYFSARSRRSSTARRPPPPPEVETEILEAPEVPEVPEAPDVPDVPEMPIYEDYEDYHHVPRRSGLTIRQSGASKVSARRMSNGMEPPIIMSHTSRAPTHISARHVALPRSGVGSSQADWDEDDDIISLAPSDSISCVGSKTSRRSRRVR